MASILVIDDEQGIRQVLQDILEDEEYRVFLAEDGISGLNTLKTELIDLVILDVWLPGKGGIEVLEEIKNDYPDIEVIVISGHANIDMAVKAIKLGAYDLMEKPLSMERVLIQIRNGLKMETLKKENRKLKAGIGARTEVSIVGNSPKLKEVRQLIDQAATTNATVLITGENGTGKELVAQSIHDKSKRAGGPFIAVNCAAIPETLIESELFGHEKGAFTGAVSKKRGKFEAAHGGTLFLDEVADLSLPAQAKILRAIQELMIERVGSNESIEVDVRIIAATNKDMKKAIDSKEFREDLYYRLHVVPIHLASLRERKDDIPVLAEHFIDLFQADENAEDQQKRSFSPEAMRSLMDYNWPGNIRQFRNLIQRFLVLTDDTEITEEVVSFALKEERQSSNFDKNFSEFYEMNLQDAKDEFERRFLLQKLEEHGYNISQTAQTLGIYPSNLHGKIKKFGIEIRK
jgi:two-component system nitrogen regulation response regulator NtrX